MEKGPGKSDIDFFTSRRTDSSDKGTELSPRRAALSADPRPGRRPAGGAAKARSSSLAPGRSRASLKKETPGHTRLCASPAPAWAEAGRERKGVRQETLRATLWSQRDRSHLSPVGAAGHAAALRVTGRSQTFARVRIQLEDCRTNGRSAGTYFPLSTQ